MDFTSGARAQEFELADVGLRYASKSQLHVLTLLFQASEASHPAQLENSPNVKKDLSGQGRSSTALSLSIYIYLYIYTLYTYMNVDTYIYNHIYIYAPMYVWAVWASFLGLEKPLWQFEPRLQGAGGSITPASASVDVDSFGDRPAVVLGRLLRGAGDLGK